LLAEAAFSGRFEVATVDHGLRAESADEAAQVAKVCAARGVPHATLPVSVEREGNLQANARSARYAALGTWAEERELAAVLTAHHRDDQAETLLMRLNRGAGVRGLAGMRGIAEVPGCPAVPLVRPLLAWSCAELGAIVAAAGLTAAHDPTNRDLRFERAAIRAELVASRLDSSALAASAGHLADADAALEWAASREWGERVDETAGALAYRPAAPRAIRLRVVARIVARLATEGTPRGGEIARFHDRIEAGASATLAGVRGSASGERWSFERAPARRHAQ
jgi:tRNA(Ile)-lysidine synthase